MWCPENETLKLFPSVSTCFAGIPSDRILFPSERGDSTSFFQYMNSSHGECSVPRGRCVERGAGSAMGVRARIIRTARGFRCSRGLVACLEKKTRCGAAHDDAAATQAQSPGEDARRGAACCSAAEKPHSEQRDFLPLPGFFLSSSPLGGKKNYEHRKRIKRRSWQPVFLLQSCIYSMWRLAACRAVRSGRGRTKQKRRVPCRAAVKVCAALRPAL